MEFVDKLFGVLEGVVFKEKELSGGVNEAVNSQGLSVDINHSSLVAYEI